MDAQGAEKARPWYEKANAEFVRLVDAENRIGELYNLKAIPLGFLVDETGRLVWGPGSSNPDSTRLTDGIREWIREGDNASIVKNAGTLEIKELTLEEQEAVARFKLGVVLYDQGKKDDALAEWRKALKLDPQNWIIHKQIWAVENPDKFYDGDVDFGWQQEMLRAGK